MANEQLTIQPNDARMTVIGKSWPDQASDSGGGDWDDTYNGTYDGPIPRTDLPVRLEIIRPPNKTVYQDGEAITNRKLSGMVCVAYKEDGAPWGSVNIWELSTNPNIAHLDGAMIGFRDVDYARISGWTQYAYLFGSFCYFNTSVQLGTWPYSSQPWPPGGTPTYAGSHTDYKSDILLTRYQGDDEVTRFYAIAYPDAVWSFCICAPQSGIYGNYYDVGTSWTELAHWESPDFENVPMSDVDPTKAEEIRLNTVTVKWQRPNDGQTLSATFEIEVTAAQNGG